MQFLKKSRRIILHDLGYQASSIKPPLPNLLNLMVSDARASIGSSAFLLLRHIRARFVFAVSTNFPLYLYWRFAKANSLYHLELFTANSLPPRTRVQLELTYLEKRSFSPLKRFSFTILVTRSLLGCHKIQVFDPVLL